MVVTDRGGGTQIGTEMCPKAFPPADVPNQSMEIEQKEQDGNCCYVIYIFEGR